VNAPWRRERGWTIDNRGGSRSGEATSNGSRWGNKGSNDEKRNEDRKK